jgi:hypothetical protein
MEGRTTRYDKHPGVSKSHIGHYFPEVIFVTILEFFIKHKVQTKF